MLSMDGPPARCEPKTPDPGSKRVPDLAGQVCTSRKLETAKYGECHVYPRSGVTIGLRAWLLCCGADHAALTC